MADQTIDMATIINMALPGIGQPPSFSLESGDTFGATCRGAYNRCRDHVFGLHDWSFLRLTRKLTRHSATPINGWTYGYDLPGDMIGAPRKLLRSLNPAVTLRDFDREALSIYCNEANVWARVTVDLDPEYWEVSFRAAFVRALEGYLAVPLLADIDMEAKRFRDAFGAGAERGAGGLIGRCIAADMAGQPIESPFTRGDPLTDARWGS